MKSYLPTAIESMKINYNTNKSFVKLYTTKLTYAYRCSSPKRASVQNSPTDWSRCFKANFFLSILLSGSRMGMKEAILLKEQSLQKVRIRIAVKSQTDNSQQKVVTNVCCTGLEFQPFSASSGGSCRRSYLFLSPPTITKVDIF